MPVLSYTLFYFWEFLFTALGAGFDFLAERFSSCETLSAVRSSRLRLVEAGRL